MMKCRILVLAVWLAAALSSARATELPTFTIAKGDIREAAVKIDATGKTELELTFTSEKQAEFGSFTENQVGKQVRILINGKVAAEPIVNEVIRGATVQIRAHSPEEALKTAKELLPLSEP